MIKIYDPKNPAGTWLKDSVSKLQTYTTPESIKKYIELEKSEQAIGNPPFKP